MAWTLCSKQDVTSIHPIAESALHDFWSDAVESMIRTHIGAPNLGALKVITYELHNGTGSSLLIVNQPPVVSVQSVLIDGEVIASTEYTFVQNGIHLFSRLFTAGNLNISVSYTSGTTPDPQTGLYTVDPVIRLCAAAMLVAIINYQGRAGSDSSIKWGNATMREGNKTSNFDVGLVDNLYAIMKRMLRRNSLRVR